MGVHIFCDNCNYYSSSSKWNAIKYDIFFYCFLHIKKKYVIIDYDIDYKILSSSISKFTLNNKLCNDLINKYYTIFEKAKITGIIRLFNKKDCDDYYSVEDASLILNMLLAIHDAVLSSDKITIDKLISIFTASVQKSLVVKIE